MEFTEVPRHTRAVDVGATIAGRYLVERLSSRGGMGAIYRGCDTETNEPVAIKIARPQLEETARARFIREAELMAAVDHPGIAAHLAHGTIGDDDLPYIVMEWIKGVNLRQHLGGKPLSVAETVFLGIDVCETVAELHRAGIVHRDIKPANLLLPGSAERSYRSLRHIKLIDFGLAHRMGTTDSTSAPGKAIGTPSFMAPEQARGQADLDHRADIYSLGAVLFNCLVGRPPYVGDRSTAVLAKVIFDEVPRPSDFQLAIPRDLDDLVCRLLAKQPDDRPDDAASVASALDHISQGLDYGPAAALPDSKTAITEGENRFVAVLLVQGKNLPGAALDRHTQKFGGRLETLANGAIAGVFADDTGSEDLVMRAAECALVMSAQLGDRTVALAVGRGVMNDRIPTGAVIDRVVSIFSDRASGDGDDQTGPQSPDGRGVTVDAVTAGLLDRQFTLVRESPERYRLVGDRTPEAAAPRLAGLVVPCVGRKRELRMLEAALAECIDEEMAGAIIMVGPAGGGKTRLCREFVHRVASGPEPVSIFSGRGSWLRARAPLSLLATIIGDAVGLVNGQSLKQKRQRITNRVAELLAADQVDRMAAFLGQLVHVPFSSAGRIQLEAARGDPQLMHDQMQRAFIDWLAAELKIQPVLLIVEDLHCSDPASLRFLEAAGEALNDRPLMILATSRPEPERPVSAFFTALEPEVVELAPLSERACEALIRQVLDAPDEVVVEITARCEGNPYLLEELIRSHHSGHAGDVPETVLAMAESRLLALPGRMRQILRAASIFGRHFWTHGVAALMGNDVTESELQDLLEQLTARELVHPSARSRFPGEDEFAFRHELTREAAYGALTDDDRKRGHMRAGVWLEQCGEDVAVVLAEHFDRGGAPGRAVLWYTRAAEQALHANEGDQVIDLVERAIACGVSGQIRGECELLRAEVHNWRGQPSRAAECGWLAIELLPEGCAAWANAIHHVVWASSSLGQLDRVEPWIAPLVSHAGPSSSDKYVIAMAHCATQFALAGKMQWVQSIARVIDEWSSGGQRSPAAETTIVHMRSFLAFLADEFDTACDLMLTAAEGWKRLGSQRNYLMDLGNAGSAQLELGEYEAAAATLGQAVTRAKEMNLDHLVATNQANRALALARSGRADEARELCAETLALAPAPRHEVIARTYLAQILLTVDKASDALQQTRQALLRADKTPTSRAIVLGIHARVLLRVGRIAEALEAASEGMELLGEFGSIEYGEGVLRLTHAEALWHAGQRDDASRAISTAVELLRDRADHIADPDRRRSFLARVPEHARTLELSRTWRAGQ